MNHDDNLSSHPSIDPELEARIVAWVLGEASPFEVAELERHLAENPALAVFKRRIEAVHGLVGEAARPAREPMVLSSERRAKVLAAIGGGGAGSGAVRQDSTVKALPLVGAKKNKSRRWQPLIWAAAACLPIAVIVLMSTTRSYKGIRFGGRDGLENGVVEMAPFEAKSTERKKATTMQVQGVVDSAIMTAVDEATIARARAARTEKLARDTNKRQTLNGGGGGGAAGGVIGGAAGKALDGNLPLVAGQGGTTWNYTGQPPSLAEPATMTNGSGIVVPGNRDFARFAGVPQPAAGDKFSFGNASTLNVTAGASLPVDSPTFSLGAADLAGKKISVDNGFVSSGADVAVANASEKTVQLSPFAVSTDTKGYYAANTMSGTRFNSKIEDVASSISVVTKEQMKDAGSLDLNDTFLAGTSARPAGQTVDTVGAVTGSGGLSGAAVGAVQVGGQAARPAAPTPLASVIGPMPGATLAAREDATAGIDADRPVDHAAARPPVDEALRAETPTSAQPISTFSLHVSDVSFRLAKAALDRGQRPDPAAIRPEEFYNAFDYGDPSPAAGEAVNCRIEQAAHPFLQQRNLVRIAMKVPATGRGAGQPLRLTVLLDTSGSMEREDRAASVRRAMAVLASLLGPDDRVTLIGFARQPRLLADRVPGDQAAKLVDLIDRTPAEGGTNLEEALKLAGERAHAQFNAGAQNRIVVLTDGAANLGNDNPEQLATQVEALRQQGIAFDACGVGADGLDDTILEALTRKGDGRYYVINSPAEADAGFAHALAGAFRPAAQNVKVQVRFNPARVRSYRLIGFEQHRLRAEDFRNDQVDAAELAAEEAAVALYQVEVLPEGEGELGDVFVRFRNTASGEMVERSWTLAYNAQPPAFDRATPTMQLAGTAAFVAEKLRGGAAAAPIRLGDLAPVMNALRSRYANEARVQELVTMFAQTRRLTGE